MKNPNPAPILIRNMCDVGKHLVALSNELADACIEIRDEVGVVDDLQSHVVALAAGLSLDLHYEWGPISSLHSAYRSGLRTASVPWSVGPYTYFMTLHELGHAALNVQGQQTPKQLLEEETAAWNWAFEQAQLQPTADVIHFKESLLDQYRHQCECEQCGKIVEVRFADDPVAYETLSRKMLGI